MRGGRRQSLGVLRAMRTQSELARQVARAAPAGGRGVRSGWVVGDGGEYARMSLQDEGMVVCWNGEDE